MTDIQVVSELISLYRSLLGSQSLSSAPSVSGPASPASKDSGKDNLKSSSNSNSHLNVDVVRHLAQSKFVKHQQEWRRLTERTVMTHLTATHTQFNEAFLDYLASLAILGGNLEALSVGNQVLYQGQKGILTGLKFVTDSDPTPATLRSLSSDQVKLEAYPHLNTPTSSSNENSDVPVGSAARSHHVISEVKLHLNSGKDIIISDSELDETLTSANGLVCLADVRVPYAQLDLPALFGHLLDAIFGSVKGRITPGGKSRRAFVRRWSVKALKGLLECEQAARSLTQHPRFNSFCTQLVDLACLPGGTDPDPSLSLSLLLLTHTHTHTHT